MSVDAIANALGLTVVRRLSGGEWGAFLVTTARGASAVLKPLPRHELFAEDRVRRAVELSRILRGDGYPIPAYLDVGVVDDQVFTLQEAIEGEVPARVQAAHLRQLIELRRRHIGAAPCDESWGEQLVADIRPDPTDGRQTSLRSCGDPRVVDILDEALAVGKRIEPGLFRCDDIVHGDFHGANLLVRGDEIVAVFDWEGAAAGDSRVDLTTLAWYLHPSDENVDAQALELLRAEIGAIQPEIRAALAARFAIDKLAFAVGTKPQVLPRTLQLTETWLRPQWQ